MENSIMPDSPIVLGDLKDISWLSHPHVHMSCPEKVIEKINCIKRGGKGKLQVIFDFDRTLTKYHQDGVRTQSSFCLLESLPNLPKGFKEKSQSILEKYLPIELDPNLTVEEKIPFMQEWWKLAIDLLKGVDWEDSVVDEHLRQNKQPFRDGTRECLEKLHDAGVPVLVFSAGIGDVVKLSLAHESFLTPNVHIVSNYLKFQEGKIIGCHGNMIHVFNKNEQLVQDTPYYAELTGRTNVILLGDSMGDANMADGIPHDTVLKIGFLNTMIEESLGQYKELFDIVLADDQTMEVLLHILRQI